MRKYIITGILVVVSLIYCLAQSNIESKPPNNFLIIDTASLKIYKYGELVESSTKFQALSQFDGNEYFIYLDNTSDSAFSNPLRFFKPSIDSVLFWNEICPLLDYTSYVNESDTLFVYRYKWVVINEPHDQAYIYCNPEYGLLALYFNHVGLLYFYEIPLIKNKIESKLLDDILRERF